jgi:molybdate transport system substrate-binding protein
MAWILAVAVLCAPAKAAEELTIAAAADLTFALKEIADNFHAQTGTEVRVSYGSSGNLSSQIKHGAPFDILFSADITYPRQLESDGFAAPHTLYQYAVGRIVLWTRNRSGLDISRGMSLLADPKVRKIAIANPTHAPYGRAAVAALKHFGLYDQVQEKLVFGENVAQAAQFADSGNADVAIIALSLALSPNVGSRGRYWQVPLDAYPPLEQGLVITAHAANKRIASDFLAFVKTKESSAILKRYGFYLPQ